MMIAIIMVLIFGVVVVGVIGLGYRAIKAPAPKICGTQKGAIVSSPRVKLSDGRHLAYREFGVPKQNAHYNIIMTHGYDNSKDMYLPLSQEFIEEVKVHIVVYDRAGYAESDPYPSRTVKTEAFDIEELAHKLELGPKFYVVGCSLGAYPIWGCLKYIPHRLLGASLVVPFVNYWWRSIPSDLAEESFRKLPRSFQRTFWIAHHAPWLYYWWTKQKWFPSMIREGMFTQSDLHLLNLIFESPNNGQEKIRQQGEYESLHRDVLASFGKWEFDPIELTNPMPLGCKAVHVWQGTQDRVIPNQLNKYIVHKHRTWIQYHEIPNAGHLLFHHAPTLQAILTKLLLP